MLKKRRTLLLAGILALAISLVATSCASSKREPGAAMDMNYTADSGFLYSPEDVKESADSIEPSASLSTVAERKVIRNASFHLQTKDYDDTMTRLEAEIAAFGGYVQQSSSYGDKTQGNAVSYLTIRIPESRYEEFKALVPTLGNVTSSSEGGDDVTAQYFDTDTRLTVLRAQETRILELLAKAETVEEMLQIESELTRIRTEIEQLTTTLKRYDDLVSYATFELNISQAAEYTLPEESFGAKLLQTMGDSLEAAWVVVQNLIFFLIWALPYLILLAVVLLIVWRVIRRKRRAASEPAALPEAETAPEETGSPEE